MGKNYANLCPKVKLLTSSIKKRLEKIKMLKRIQPSGSVVGCRGSDKLAYETPWKHLECRIEKPNQKYHAALLVYCDCL